MEEHLNQILMVSIVIIMIIIILNKNKNVCVKEGFLNGEPKHVPRNFELHEIDHKNKFMSFIFNSPRPYIIGNLVRNLKKINNIDGFLIGGASQSAKKFIDIVKKTYS